MATTDSTGTVLVGDEDNGAEVDVHRGGVLEVRLDAVPGTGYGWQPVELDTRRLEPAGEPVTEYPEQPMPGAHIFQVFRFNALAPGAVVLRLHYLRPWEKDSEPLKTFRITVNIK